MEEKKTDSYFEKSIQNVYSKSFNGLIKENAPLTAKVLKIFREENLSVSRALRILEESAYLIKEITII